MGNPRRLGRMLTVGLTSLALAVAGTAYLTVTTTSTADAAIAGSRTLLNNPGQTLTDSLPTCPALYDDNCRSYPLQLTAGTYFQAQLNAPTSSADIGLFDDLGTKLVSTGVSSQSTGYIEQKVSRTGAYVLSVGSDVQLHFDLFAFETPQTLTRVALPSTIRNQFNSTTTRQVSNKDVTYWDGVTLNGTKNRRLSVVFQKPGDSDATITLYDSFNNQLTSDSGTGSSKFTYTLPYSGFYEVTIGGSSQGNYTLRLLDPDVKVHVQSVKVSKTKVTVRKNHKVKVRAIITPSNATTTTVRWKSSKPSVASVSKSGVIKGKRKGKAVIKATTVDGNKVASVRVKVRR